MNNRRFFSALVLGFYSCLVQVAHAEVIKVGVVAGFNSVLASEATEIKNGVSLAVKDIGKNASKRFKVSVIERDSQLNPQMAGTVLSEITNGMDGVRYVIGPQGTVEIAEAAKIAQARDLVLISPSLRSDDLGTLHRNLFTTRHSQQQESAFIAPIIKRVIGTTPLNTVILDTSGGSGFIQAFKPAYLKVGGRFGFFEDLSLEEPSYNQIIRRLTLNRATDLYVVSMGVHVADLMIEAANAGLKIRYYGTSDSQSPALLKRAGNLAEGFLYPYPFDPITDPKSSAFAMEYRVKFGAEPGYVAANAYDALMILSECLEKVGDNPSAVRSCLHYVKNYQGAGGPLSIDSNSNCTRKLFLKSVKNGSFIGRNSSEGDGAK